MEAEYKKEEMEFEEIADKDDFFETAKPSASEKFKEGAKTVLGLGAREEYDNTAQYILKHVSNNGILGVVKGVVLAAFAVVGHSFHVIVTNAFFGGTEHFNFKRALAQTLGGQDLKDATAENNRNKKEERKAEQTNGEKDQKTNEATTKEAEKDKSEEQINDMEQDLNPVSMMIQEVTQMNTPELSDYMNEFEEDIENLTKDKTAMDEVITKLFQYPAVKEFLQEFQLEPYIDHNTDQVLLFQTDRENNLEKIPYVSKEDIIRGNAQAFGAALYQDKKEDSRDASLLASAKAVMLTAKLRNEVFSGPLEDARECMNDKNKDYVVLSYVITDCPDNSSGLLYTALSPTKESVELYYKNSFIGTFDLRENFEVVADKVYEQMVKIDKEQEKEEYSIGDTISFSRDEKNMVMVEVNGEGKVFPLSCERDMKAIAEYIAEKAPDKAATAQIDAMIIGAKINPYMEKTINEDGCPINPFTEKVVDKGDLIFSLNDGVAMICEYDIGISSAIGMAGCTVEEIKEIAYVPTDGFSYQLENIEEKVKEYMDLSGNKEVPEALTAMDATIFGPVDPKASRPFDMVHTVNGHAAYTELKVEALLDGRDISGMEITEHEDCRHHNEEMFAGDDALFREAEENMRNHPEMTECKEQEEEPEL